ncbi:MAG: hypothetical protein LBM73_00790 [Candidatus Nomurabacteria bacterium]|jgi:hypothetical protein|nr:hypothetical protein [Candidatus Nomurabacteria bacterium]
MELSDGSCVTLPTLDGEDASRPLDLMNNLSRIDDDIRARRGAKMAILQQIADIKITKSVEKIDALLDLYNDVQVLDPEQSEKHLVRDSFMGGVLLADCYAAAIFEIDEPQVPDLAVAIHNLKIPASDDFLIGLGGITKQEDAALALVKIGQSEIKEIDKKINDGSRDLYWNELEQLGQECDCREFTPFFRAGFGVVLTALRQEIERDRLLKSYEPELLADEAIYGAYKKIVDAKARR